MDVKVDVYDFKNASLKDEDRLELLKEHNDFLFDKLQVLSMNRWTFDDAVEELLYYTVKILMEMYTLHLWRTFRQLEKF